MTRREHLAAIEARHRAEVEVLEAANRVLASALYDAVAAGMPQDEARDRIARPMRLAEAAVALIDTEMSVPRLYERIKKWEQREMCETELRVALDDTDEPAG